MLSIYRSMRLQMVVKRALMSVDCLAYSSWKICVRRTYCGEVLGAVLGHVSASMSVEYGEEAGVVGSEIVGGDVVCWGQKYYLPWPGGTPRSFLPGRHTP
jgi:hypothetical protein